ncbi:MAG TPA: hypothetical protein VJ860_06520 [Polyangia bacterium]|jgi:hypothetical protein|nr:hypothetical protein [Polyangia bacterium]
MQTLFSAPRHGWKTIILALLAMPSLAMAADEGLPRLGLSPAEPQVRSATPSVPFGINPAESKEFVLDFHGYLLLPATVGVHDRISVERTDPITGALTDPPTMTQGGTVLHTPPLLAQNLRSFEYTGAVPTPWGQLNFIYGNKTVSGTVIMAATTFSDAAGYYNIPGQLGVNDAFITVNATKYFHFPFQLNVGAYTGRYGAMGAYDAGRYATPLIARTNSIGETITTGYKLGEFFLVLEQGLGGQLGRPPVGLIPQGWNDFSDADVGATFVGHLHLGLAYGGLGHLGLHYLAAWTQDDQVKGGNVPNGQITVLGADAQVTAGRYGHLYLGVAHTKAKDAATISGAIEILNARGGPELIAQYLGPNSNGNGSLTTFGAQYDLSVSRLVFDKLYTGMSPDVLVSLFTVGTSVSSDDKDYNGVFKVKLGGEVTYLMKSWLGVSERFDHVRLHGADSKKAFSIMTTRLLFHTGWRSRDEFALHYSYFQNGSDIVALTGFPPGSSPSANPDRHVFTLSGTFWW